MKRGRPEQLPSAFLAQFFVANGDDFINEISVEFDCQRDATLEFGRRCGAVGIELIFRTIIERGEFFDRFDLILRRHPVDSGKEADAAIAAQMSTNDAAHY